jgi:hypothetical protein
VDFTVSGVIGDEVYEIAALGDITGLTGLQG